MDRASFEDSFMGDCQSDAMSEGTISDSEDDYILRVEDLTPDRKLNLGLNWTTCTIEAARNPNKAILQHLFGSNLSSALPICARWVGRRYCQRSRFADFPPCYTTREELIKEQLNRDAFTLNESLVHGYRMTQWSTPLLQAIRSGLPENVYTLLSEGANPDGVPLWRIEGSATPFLRFLPPTPTAAARKEFLACMKNSQLSPLTNSEFEERQLRQPAPFWTENSPKPWIETCTNGSTSLIEAASRDPVIFEQLRAFGADASFWLEDNVRLPEDLTPSSLVHTTPLHIAIENKDEPLVRYLLDTGLNPNIQALSAPTKCYPPIVSAIIGASHWESWDKTIYNLLAEHPLIDMQRRTPVYSVHLLHFVVAKLSVEILNFVLQKVSLEDAGCTELGQNLLHVACLPSDRDSIRSGSDKCFRSIHTTCDLRNELQRDQVGMDVSISAELFDVQLDMIKLLIESGFFDVAAQDKHGNTCLHYLAGYAVRNEMAIEFLSSVSGGHATWCTSRNNWGFTPYELYSDSTEGLEFRMKAMLEKAEAARKHVEEQDSIWKFKLNKHCDTNDDGAYGNSEEDEEDLDDEQSIWNDNENENSRSSFGNLLPRNFRYKGGLTHNR